MPRPGTRWIGACALALVGVLPGCGAEPGTVPVVVHAELPAAATSTTTTSTSTTSTTAAARVCCAYTVERAARSRVPATSALPPAPPAAPPAPPAAAQGAQPAMSSLLRRIGGCESAGHPDAPIRWQAENPTSTASGGFQILDSTWRGWARSYGAGTDAAAYGHAASASPATQTVVAQRALDAQGTAPWRASRACWA